MFQDLGRRAPDGVLHCDICVVGAGPVGLVVARSLAEQHRQVIVLDAGPLNAVVDHPVEPRFDRRPYLGATEGRAFGFGGTSALWGGQLLPVRPQDLLARPQNEALAWPVAYADLERHFAKLQRWLQVSADGFDLPADDPAAALQWLEWTPRRSQWIPFERRNIGTAWRRELAGLGVQVWLNACVDTYEFAGTDGSRQLTKVIARSGNGHTLQVIPRVFVLCAGGVESARMVLEMHAQSGGLGPGVGKFAGHYLHDHLSMKIARLEVVNRRRLQELFAPRFTGAIMRSLRMEVAAPALARDGLPALYAHLIAETGPESGFAIIRDVLRAGQRGRPGDALRALGRIPRAFPEIIDVLYWRFLGHRLAFPKQSNLYVSIDFEQPPSFTNRLYLGPPPAAGRRALHIDWDVPAEAVRFGKTARAAFNTFWSTNQLDGIARVEDLDLDAAGRDWVSNLHGLYHAAGTTRMSSEPEGGVVDPDLRIHGTRNAFVVGSSVFPSMGAANPTFTAMALALRLADCIARRHPG